jgi:hypothetical protein
MRSYGHFVPHWKHSPVKNPAILANAFADRPPMLAVGLEPPIVFGAGNGFGMQLRGRI